MKKSFTFILCLIGFISTSQSDIANADSIQLSQNIEGIKSLIRSGNDSANVAMEALYKTAKEHNSNFGLSQYYYLKGFSFNKNGKYEDAISAYNEAINIQNDSLSTFSIDQLNRIAGCYKDLTQFEKASTYFNAAAELSKKSSYFKGAGDSYAGIGQILESNGRYKDGMEYYLQARDYFEKATDSTGIASSYNNIGNMMYYQGEMEQAMDYYKKSARIDYLTNNNLNLAMGYGNIGMIYQQLGQFDSSLYYNELCMFELERINNPFYLGTIYNNIALVYFDLTDFETSLKYHLKSKKIKEEIGDLSGLATSVINIGNLYIEMGEYNTSIPYYEQGIEICDKLNTPLLKMNVYKGLAKAYQETGKYKNALELYIVYSEINDSLSSAEAKTNVAALETEFETKQKDELLSQQKLAHKKELALEEAKSKNKNILLYGALLLVLVVIIFISIIAKKLKESRKQKALIQNKNKENELLLGEIHHRVKNNLQVISSLLSLQEKNISDSSAKKAILESKERVKSMGLIHKMLYQNDNFSGIEMSDYVTNLVHGLMDSFGMSEAQLELDTKFKSIKLDVDSAIPVGLIINELVINAFKYAYDKSDQPKMSVKLNEIEEGLVLEIVDNGDGLVDTVNGSNSFGLKLVKSLVRQLNGELSLEDKGGLSYRILIKDYKLV